MQCVGDAPNEIDELALLRRQDADAFARLVALHQRVVLGLAQSRGLRGPDIDDAAAETFAVVWRALPRFEGRSAIGTWVYRIACRTIGRRRDRSSGPGDGAGQPREAVDPAAEPPLQLVNAERDRLIWDAVAALEPRQAMAVELYYRRGASVDEVAAALECPPATAKTLLHRARQSLREALERRGVT